MSDNGTCKAKNGRATCRKHGWIKAPISGPEAEKLMIEAGHRVQSGHGRKGLYHEAENNYKKATQVFHETPEGQKVLKNRINLIKSHDGYTVSLKDDLDNAKYVRAIQETSFKIEGFLAEVEEQKFPNIKSDKGEKLIKRLEKIKGSKVSEDTWGEAIESTRSALNDQASHRYRKSFANRLTVDLKEYGMTKKQVSKAKNEFTIKNKRGEQVATLFFKEDGKTLHKAFANVAGGYGLTKDFTDGSEFRVWLERNKRFYS